MYKTYTIHYILPDGSEECDPKVFYRLRDADAWTDVRRSGYITNSDGVLLKRFKALEPYPGEGSKQ